MKIFPLTKKSSLPKRLLCGITAFFFLGSTISPSPSIAQIIPQTILNLPVPGTMVSLSPSFAPAMIKGMTIYPEDPFKFDFIIDKGDTALEGEAFKTESAKLIKYFLASLTTSEEKMWVNLSPYEKDRIIADGFDTTEMGRDLLAQDYILKQLTASLLYPENELGKSFWNKVYAQAQEKLGITDIPMDTFNKVWIIPERAEVYVHDKSAFVVESHLKVMLEEDYAALNHQAPSINQPKIEDKQVPAQMKEVLKEIIIPAIEKEVNEGKNFAQLRQIYNSLILATWYKKNLKKSLFGQVYIDKNKTKGVDVEDKQIKQKIYEQYLAAFKKGAYDYIKEDYNPETQEVVSKKYFSGGVDYAQLGKIQEEKSKLTQKDFAQLGKKPEAVTVKIKTTSSDVGNQTTPSPYIFDPDNMRWVEANLVTEINGQRLDTLVSTFIKDNNPKDYDYYIFSLMQHIRYNGLHRDGLKERYLDLRFLIKTLPRFVKYFVDSEGRDKDFDSILIPAHPSKNQLPLTKGILYLWIIAGSLDPLIYPDTTNRIAKDDESLARLMGKTRHDLEQNLWLIDEIGKRNVYVPNIDQADSRQRLMLILKKVISSKGLRALLRKIINTNWSDYDLPHPASSRSMVFFNQLDRYDDDRFAGINFLDYLSWNDVYTAEVAKERKNIYQNVLKKDVASLNKQIKITNARRSALRTPLGKVDQGMLSDLSDSNHRVETSLTSPSSKTPVSEQEIWSDFVRREWKYSFTNEEPDSPADLLAQTMYLSFKADIEERLQQISQQLFGQRQDKIWKLLTFKNNSDDFWLAVRLDPVIKEIVTQGQYSHMFRYPETYRRIRDNYLPAAITKAVQRYDKSHEPQTVHIGIIGAGWDEEPISIAIWAQRAIEEAVKARSLPTGAIGLKIHVISKPGVVMSKIMKNGVIHPNAEIDKQVKEGNILENDQRHEVKRYFENMPESGGYKRSKELNRLIEYKEGDLLESETISATPAFDVLLVHNVLQYLMPKVDSSKISFNQAAKNAFDFLENHLTDDGVISIMVSGSIPSDEIQKLREGRFKNKLVYEYDAEGDTGLYQKIKKQLISIPGVTEDSFKDAAMLPNDQKILTTENPGGINLNPTQMDLQTNGEEAPLYAPVDPAVLKALGNIDGAYPVIINVAPITNLPLLLGIANPNPQNEKPTEVSYNLSSIR